jgi:hypothetical protein
MIRFLNKRAKEKVKRAKEKEPSEKTKDKSNKKINLHYTIYSIQLKNRI